MFKTAIITTLATASAIKLTPDNWDSETAGKTVFVKMFAPWCGHCKRMAPHWDKVMAEINVPGSSTLVADVDCTAAGKPICDSNGVKGFPTVKFGDPSALEDYQGGRELDDLMKFAKSLKPSCSPANLDLCDDDAKAEINKFMDLDDAKLDELIQEKNDEVAAAEKHFETELEKLQSTYKKLSDDKDASIAAVKESGLGMMKAVKAAKATNGKEEL